jgi:hypothetical protein
VVHSRRDFSYASKGIPPVVAFFLKRLPDKFGLPPASTLAGGKREQLMDDIRVYCSTY